MQKSFIACLFAPPVAVLFHTHVMMMMMMRSLEARRERENERLRQSRPAVRLKNRDRKRNEENHDVVTLIVADFGKKIRRQDIQEIKTYSGRK